MQNKTMMYITDGYDKWADNIGRNKDSWIKEHVCSGKLVELLGVSDDLAYVNCGGVGITVPIKFLGFCTYLIVEVNDNA